MLAAAVAAARYWLRYSERGARATQFIVVLTLRHPYHTLAGLLLARQLPQTLGDTLQFLPHRCLDSDRLTTSHSSACLTLSAAPVATMDPAEIWRSLPVITRGYVSLCVVTTAACALEVSRKGRAARWRVRPLAVPARRGGSACLPPGAATEEDPLPFRLPLAHR